MDIRVTISRQSNGKRYTQHQDIDVDSVEELADNLTLIIGSPVESNGVIQCYDEDTASWIIFPASDLHTVEITEV